MAERFKAHAWKVCVPSQVPWVRIPLSPPKFRRKNSKKINFLKDRKIINKILNKPYISRLIS